MASNGDFIHSECVCSAQTKRGIGRLGMDTDLLAKEIRIRSLEMTSRCGGSHIASVFSIADILAVLYGAVLNVRPEEPHWADRDRLVLSKGHAAAGLYAVLAAVGYLDGGALAEYCGDGSPLCGHASTEVPGVEFSTGSLGHGLSVAAGMALAARMDSRFHRVFAVLGDGECDEGSIWEAALFAAHHGLSNLVAVIDSNGLQGLGTVTETLGLEPLSSKWRAFGWDVLDVNGHSHDELKKALAIESSRSAMPTCVIARTVKGKGVSFMENSVLWHYRCPRDQEFRDAMSELRSKPHEE